MFSRLTRGDVLACCGLLAVTWVALSGVLSCEFVSYDDPMYVLNNPAVTGGLTANNVSWAWAGQFGFWHPLTWMSLQLDAELFGLNPARFHLTNLLLHSANVLLLYWVLTSLTGARWPSAAVAALFAVHPLNVETVAWVSERKGLLSMFFGLLAIGTYGVYVRTGQRGWYAFVLVAQALSLLAKPVFVTLPLLLLLLDYWPLRRFGSVEVGGRTWRQLVIEKLPMVGLAIAVGVVTIVYEERFSALPSLSNRSAYSRATNGIVSYAEYLRKAVYPDDLAPFYPHPGRSLPGRTIAISALLLGILTLVAWRTRRQAPYLFVGWMWFVVALLPMSGLIQVGAHAMADRYAYLPLIGLFVACCWGVWELGARQSWLPVAVSVTAIGLACVGARAQALHWKTSETLWEHTLSVTSNNHRAHFHLGKIRAEQGNGEEAIRQFQAGLQFHPQDERANYYLGYLLADRSRWDEAAVSLTRATEAAPRFADAWWQLGRVERRRKNLVAARAALSTALQLNPNHPQALAERGTLFARMGQAEDGIRDLQAALKLGYESADIYNNLGIGLAELGHFDAARECFRSAIRLAPNSPDGHLNIGILAERTGQWDEAVNAYTAAAQLDATDANSRVSLGLLLRRLGRFPEAAASLQSAVNLKPEAAELWHELGLTWEAAGKLDQAAEAYRRAVHLRSDAACFRLSLGSVLVDQKQLDAAASEFRAAQADTEGLRQCAQTALRLAAHPDAAVREEKVAVCLARAVSRGSGDRDPHLLDILAIAHAAAGQFAFAVQVEQKAIGLTAANHPEERTKREGLLKSFRESKPVRDSNLK